MEYYGRDMTIFFNEEYHRISEKFIKEILRQLNIQRGKDILENYKDELARDINSITDDEFAEFAIDIENETYIDNGDIEWRVVKQTFGVKED